MTHFEFNECKSSLRLSSNFAFSLVNSACQGSGSDCLLSHVVHHCCKAMKNSGNRAPPNTHVPSPWKHFSLWTMLFFCIFSVKVAVIYSWSYIYFTQTLMTVTTILLRTTKKRSSRFSNREVQNSRKTVTLFILVCNLYSLHWSL